MRKSLLLLAIFALILPVMFLGCEGDDGPEGPQGPQGEQGIQGPPGPPGVTTLSAETCALCHNDTFVRDGQSHQDYYDSLYQAGVIQVSAVSVVYTGPNIYTTTLTMTKDGDPFPCEDADALSVTINQWTGTGFEMPDISVPADGFGDRISLTPSSRSEPTGTTAKSSDAAGVCTIVATFDEPVADYLTGTDGLVGVYGRDNTVTTLPGTRVTQAKYPFAALLPRGVFTIGTYTSAANVAGCEKCHTVPFLKHGYELGEIGSDPDTQFYLCKTCHIDNGEGGHFEWQLSNDVPERWAAIAAQVEESGGEFGDYMTEPELAKYSYTTRLMNDVHMSHAMEFPYPQSMSNCVTCHEGKLGAILTDANFVVETCKSCHPQQGVAEYSGGIAGSEPYQAADTRPGRENGTNTLALRTIMPPALHNGGTMPLDGSVVCNICHSAAGGIGAPVFSDIHSGYDKRIYTAAGERYSDAITASIGTPSFDSNTDQLSFSISATGSLNGLDNTDITGSVLVGLYGYDTKDFVVGPHRETIDEDRDLEAAIGGQHPRITITPAAAGSWDVTADLSAWDNLIMNGTVKKAEIAFEPQLDDANGVAIAINAPSVTFSLVDNAVVQNYFKGTNQIVKVEKGCNNCHDALGTTFHEGSGRVGNIVVCRLCHVSIDDGSHLEMQSRSITSYAHAIHSFQAFDIGDIDFTDPVLALHYEQHVEFQFPTLGIQDCEACHAEGKFSSVDQAKSLAGLLSGSDNVVGRSISADIPKRVIGPAGLACGSCHRSHEINEDEAGELASLFSHWKQFGYLVDIPPDKTSQVTGSTAEEDAITFGVIETIMAMI